MTTVDVLESTYQKTHGWLRELVEIGDLEGEPQAYSALRAVLHALRDRLTVNEAADLAAQLPLLVRGVYYEGWVPSAVPVKQRHREEFLEAVREQMRHDVNLDVSQAAEAVFELLARKITAGELRDVTGMLPGEVREMWPEPFGHHHGVGRR